ncbi:OmpH family outer membrane protein [Pseudomaricurvus sp.]|uniref:OmpH family outer membrane protein n=1 Tax=Pseudomaricurvus sp. TaxID=2004510 RepID=UPI003F6CCFAD
MKFNRLLSVLFVGVLSCATLPVLAASSEKYGYVDVEQLFNTPAAQEIVSKRQQHQNQTRAELTQMQQKLEQEYKELSALANVDPMTLSADQKAKLDQFRKDQMAFEQKVAAAQEVPASLNQDMEKFQEHMTTVIGKVAKQHGVTMVVNKEAILWSEPVNDLTADVLKEMK